jgi:rubrerythrin
MTDTDQNLAAAFAGESQANRKYLFFADKAAAEGFPQVARLFRAAADAETVHAHNHFNVMRGVGGTADNLKAAVSGENYEFTQMYPAFIEQARKDGNARADTSFSYANDVEEIHHSLFQKALGDLGIGAKSEAKPYFVCQTCGNTVLGEAPDVCPICGSPRSKFKRID